MSELTTGGINFGYQSPISQIYKDVEYKFKEDMENKTMEAVHRFGISVDKEELIKALQYDRNQYDKGYLDGRASIVEELEKIKTEIKRRHNITCKLTCARCFLEYNCTLRKNYVLLENLAIIDKHIKKLKGED